jgi:hypothetical protein
VSIEAVVAGSAVADPLAVTVSAPAVSASERDGTSVGSNRVDCCEPFVSSWGDTREERRGLILSVFGRLEDGRRLSSPSRRPQAAKLKKFIFC